MKSKKSFIYEANLKHNNKFDYSIIDYKTLKTKIGIICPDHGLFFQSPAKHLLGQQCPECSINSTRKKQMKSVDKFISEAINVHGDEYDYSKVEYKGNKTKVIIICPIHGEFEQTPDGHLSGRGCKYCGGTAKMDTKSFITKANIIHNNEFDYSKVEYVSSLDAVEIICKYGHTFKQSPNNHISKAYGCPICKGHLNKETFEIKSNAIHDNRYDYSNVKYIDKHTLVELVCYQCGESFDKTPYQHIDQQQGCSCYKPYTLEDELFDFVNDFDFSIIRNDKTILDGLELDIYIPNKKIAIEFDGLYWHSEVHKDKKYHLNKTELCEKKGIQLIHIFEDEWIFKKNIVKSRLKNILGLTSNKIFGRKTVVKEVETKQARIFFENNHLQGYVNSKIKLGLYYGDELVSCMTFGVNRAILKNKRDDNSFELLRFANNLDTTVVGGASKLFNHFIKCNDINSIVTYADRRWSMGDLYQALGFEFVHNTEVGFSYIKNKHRESRFKYQKHKILDLYGEDFKTHLYNDGIFKIYDCGNKKYRYDG